VAPATYPRHCDKEREARPNFAWLLGSLIPTQLVGQWLQEGTQRLELRDLSDHDTEAAAVATTRAAVADAVAVPDSR
jgi:hypothetical protein